MDSWSVGYGEGDVERHAGVDGEAGPEKPPLRLRVVSDYIWPWCYIGLVRAERLREEFQVELEACAFDLRPGLPPLGQPRDEVYRDRAYPPGYLENLRQMAASCGIQMQRPDIVANTRKAHEATEFAREHGRLAEFQRAVFRAYWEEEQNISEVEVLCRLAGGCGLDAEELRRALDEGHYSGRVEEQMAWSRAAGVGGVPTFIFNDRFAVVGAQDYEVFRDIAGRIVRGEIKSED